MIRARPFLLLAAAAGALAPAARAQVQAAPPDPEPLAVGTVAPDFTLPGATRFGTLRDPVRLSALRGKTVVLAFYYKARTRG